MLRFNDNVNRGDLGYIWRTQTGRSMDQLDKLYRLKYFYAKKLGDAKVKEIEADVNLFADADQFRIYHAVGRFRGTICSLVSTAVFFTLVNGGRNGMGAIKKHPILASGYFVANWAVFYKFWSY